MFQTADGKEAQGWDQRRAFGPGLGLGFSFVEAEDDSTDKVASYSNGIMPGGENM